MLDVRHTNTAWNAAAISPFQLGRCFLIIYICFLPDLFCKLRYTTGRREALREHCRSLKHPGRKLARTVLASIALTAANCALMFRFGFHILGMMKRQEHKRRFYLWDYLWWQGEMIKKRYDRPLRWTDGSFGLMFYIVALIILPLMFLCRRTFPETNGLTEYIVSCIIAVAAHEWLERIYRTRGKSVLKHHAKRKFNPVWAYFLALLLPLVILLVLMSALAPQI